MKNIFEEQGYLKLKINPLFLASKAQDEIEIIRNNFDSLTKDPYSETRSNRFRSYSNLIILPWDRKIIWLPLENKSGRYVSSYWQGGFNPEHVGACRSFTPLSTEVKNTNLLNNLILHDFDLTFWKTGNTLPIYVGVHFVKLLVMEKNEIAFSSPDLLHRDGEAFTFAHLFERKNVQGGVNYISTPELANNKIGDVPEDKILMKFELHEPFESYAVCDEMVSHYVSPIKIDNPELSCGVREIMLIDFSNMQQQI